MIFVILSATLTIAYLLFMIYFNATTTDMEKFQISIGKPMNKRSKIMVVVDVIIVITTCAFWLCTMFWFLFIFL